MELQQVLPPGFRFSPTDEELVVFYLRKKAFDKHFSPGVIAELDCIYKFEPWDLPEKSLLRSADSEWYFFNAVQDRKKSRTAAARINRTTRQGFWKATGKDRNVCRGTNCIVVGVKKTLVYYEGRARHGERRTNWVMHEYGLDEESAKKAINQSVVICRVRNKKRSTGPGPCRSNDGELHEYANDETAAAAANIVESDDVDEEEPPDLKPSCCARSPDFNLPEVSPEFESLTVVQSLFDSDDVSPPPFILGEAEMSHLIVAAAPSQGDHVSNIVQLNERMMSQAPTTNNLLISDDDHYLMVGVDYTSSALIAHDISSPLIDIGSVLLMRSSPIHWVEFTTTGEEQQRPISMADNNGVATDQQYSTQGSAARLQIPAASGGNTMNAKSNVLQQQHVGYIVFPQR